MSSTKEWLQHRIDHYRAHKTDTCEAIEDLDDLGKLGQGFTSAYPLEEVDIGDGIVPTPTFVNKNLDPTFKLELIKILKEYFDCFAWNYNEIPGVDGEIPST
jgi:hexokinase